MNNYKSDFRSQHWASIEIMSPCLHFIMDFNRIGLKKSPYEQNRIKNSSTRRLNIH